MTKCNQSGTLEPPDYTTVQKKLRSAGTGTSRAQATVDLTLSPSPPPEPEPSSAAAEVAPPPADNQESDPAKQLGE